MKIISEKNNKEILIVKINIKTFDSKYKIIIYFIKNFNFIKKIIFIFP